MRTEILDIKNIEIGEETEEQLTYLLVAKDEILAMIDRFGPEEELIEELQKLEKEIKNLKNLIKFK